MDARDTGDAWVTIGAQLRAPFPPDAVEWRPASGKGGAGQRVMLVAYVDAAMVMDRLDETVGPGGWSFTLEPLVIDGGELRRAKGRLEVLGVVREGVGTASNFEPSKGCASDTLKRCAVLFGIGRYLGDLPQVACVLDDRGQIPTEMRQRLQQRLAARAGEKRSA